VAFFAVCDGNLITEQQQNHPLIKDPIYSSDSEEWRAAHDKQDDTRPVPLRPVQLQAG